MKKLAILSLIFVGLVGFWPAQAEERAVEIYFNEACSGCNVYLQEKLKPFFEERGYVVVMRDYINEDGARGDLLNKNTELEIPLELQGHIMTFIDGGDLVFAGHVPTDLISEALTAKEKGELSERLIVYQDVMLEMSNKSSQDIEYAAWSPGREPKYYSLETNLSEHLNWLAENIDTKTNWRAKSILPLILATGFLDGLNPCAFAVLLLFIAFLFTLRRTRGHILGMGAAYILGVLLAYVLIGLGLLQAIVLSDQPHLMARIASWLIIVLGLYSLIQYFWPSSPLRFGIPSFSKSYLQSWIERATLPAALTAGFLVGLCTFPCSGGIYVGILGLLASQVTYWRGLGYLALYNIMFISPLVILLVMSSNKYTIERLEKWQKKSSRALHLVSGLAMILVGVIVLLFFV